MNTLKVLFSLLTYTVLCGCASHSYHFENVMQDSKKRTELSNIALYIPVLTEGDFKTKIDESRLKNINFQMALLRKGLNAELSSRGVRVLEIDNLNSSIDAQYTHGLGVYFRQLRYDSRVQADQNSNFVQVDLVVKSLRDRAISYRSTVKLAPDALLISTKNSQAIVDELQEKCIITCKGLE